MGESAAKRIGGNVLDVQTKRYIHDFFPCHERERVGELVRRFCFNGQAAIAALLTYAEEEGKLDVAMNVVEGHWQDHWIHQDPEVCGDISFGKDNLPRLAACYIELDIMPPWERGEARR